MTARERGQAPSPGAGQGSGRGERHGRQRQGLADPIASGRRADVHPWDEGHVLKLYRPGTSPETVEYERRKTTIAHTAGLPVPAAGKVVEVDGRLGLVLERLDGPSMMETLLQEPDVVEPMADRLASLHLKLHALPWSAALPDQRALLQAKISRSPLLSQTERGAALAALDRLPGGNRLCHGDFHPGNVILTERGPFIIDWIDASRGNPIADVARTAILFLGHIENPMADSGPLTAMKHYYRFYLDAYLQPASEAWAEFRLWLPIMAAARLSEGIEEQQEWLRKVARAGLAEGESPER